MSNTELFAALGIPSDYGLNPRRPRFAEARVLEDVGPNILGKAQQLAPETAQAWRDLRAAAGEDGIELLLVSGFRSIAYQAELIRRKLTAGQSIDVILRVNAAPGFSEHHTGRALDLATPGARPLTEEFADSRAFAWLETHAGRFGFGMPYGPDNAYGFVYEPWHWSQVGQRR